MRLSLIAFVFVSPYLVQADADPEPPTGKPREVTVKGLTPTTRPEAGLKPIKITSAEDLAKVIEDKGVQAEITKQVDFKKEYLVYCAWAGSGRDKIVLTEAKGKEGPEVHLNYTRGLTRDLVTHGKLFAIPEKTTYKVVRKLR